MEQEFCGKSYKLIRQLVVQKKVFKGIAGLNVNLTSDKKAAFYATITSLVSTPNITAIGILSSSRITTVLNR